MIKIDSREKKYIKMCEYLAESLPDGTTFNVEKLDHGADYLVNNENELAIQRKTVNDFTGSLDTLKETLHKLRSNYELSALLIEGDWKIAGSQIALRRGGRLVQTGVSFKVLHNFVLSQQLRGTMFFRTASMRETAMLLSNVHGYLDGSISPSVEMSDPHELWVNFPNIGPERADAINRFYDSPYKAIRQCPEGWSNVDGIGPATVEQIIDWLKLRGGD